MLEVQFLLSCKNCRRYAPRNDRNYSPLNGATCFNLALALEATGDIDGALENAAKAAELGLVQAREYADYLNSRLSIQAPE